VLPTDDEILGRFFSPLVEDLKAFEHEFKSKPVLLAHYTSLEAFESIVKNNEIWFSNPLFMNDLEEVKFGIFSGINAAKTSAAIKKALSPAQYEQFNRHLDAYFQQFEKDHVFDTYVFGASRHDPSDTDGKLSMWRGYGGNAKGVAIVFDTANMNIADEVRPLIVSKVFYGTVEERSKYLTGYCDKIATIFASSPLPDAKLHLATWALFDRIKLFALFTKHRGFAEEEEWRVVYMRDRDKDKKFDPMFSYVIGSQGVEPKLKLKVAPLAGILADDLSLEKIVHSIILGPSASSALALASVKRMLNLLGRPELAARVSGSTTPLRIK